MMFRLRLFGLALSYRIQRFVLAIWRVVSLSIEAFVVREKLIRRLSIEPVDRLYPELKIAICFGFSLPVLRLLRGSSLVVAEEIDRKRIESTITLLHSIDSPCHHLTTRHGQELFQSALITLLIRATNNRNSFPFRTDFNECQSLTKRLAETLTTTTLIASSSCSIHGGAMAADYKRRKHVFRSLQQLYAKSHAADMRKIQFEALRQRNRALGNAELFFDSFQDKVRS